MGFNSDSYYGYIVKGDLQGAINYVKQFPEQRDLYNRFLRVFEHEQYITYDGSAELNEILTTYQQYYRDVFYLGINREQTADTLKKRIIALLGIPDEQIELCDLEQKYLSNAFRQWGLHFLGGKTGGYYGPYIWKTSETVSYDVELPDGVQAYSVRLLGGFITRSWIDYLSFGEIGSGGWADGDGYINCVKSAWDLDSESFRVSLLKHEAQHARDLEMNKEMSSEDLEYRAKLVELIYSTERNLLQVFVQEADPTDRSNGHAMAAYRIVKDFANAMGDINPAIVPIGQIQSVARMLFESQE